MLFFANVPPAGIEPRHTPTRVAFFTTRDGFRVRSAAGGRTYSAVTTVDGRVFKWGMRSATKTRDKGYGGDDKGGEDRGNDPSEKDEVSAVEASVPHQVAGFGVEVSDSLRCVLRHWFVCLLCWTTATQSLHVLVSRKIQSIESGEGETFE